MKIRFWLALLFGVSVSSVMGDRPLAKPHEARGIPHQSHVVFSKATEHPSSRPSDRSGGLNIGFAHDPGQGHYDGVVGSPSDVWNFVDIGTTAVDYMRHPDATSSTARLRVTRHDGEWGITGHTGIFRGYIYHNCQCVDLEATLTDLEPATYRAYVYAHGDAPNQNALIEVVVGDRTIGQKRTSNDETWRFRDREFQEGIHYVTFDFTVAPSQQVKVISHRDGSAYSMFNAIQIVRIDPSEAEDKPLRSPRSKKRRRTDRRTR